MPRDYTVIYTHPSGATATFIYTSGELSALAKGLDAEQFWVFKQVKALLLRNEEDDLALASEKMREHGFTTQISQPLPDLLAPVVPTRAPSKQAIAPEYYFRPLPDLGNAFPSFGPGTQVSEIHWRESPPAVAVPPHRAPGLKLPPPDENNAQPVAPYVAPTASQVSEIHWRETNDQH